MPNKTNLPVGHLPRTLEPLQLEHETDSNEEQAFLSLNEGLRHTITNDSNGLHANNGLHDSTDLHDNTPSNEKLLIVAFISFMSFALIQLFFAFVADSQAMIGDSAAMIVDAFTYLINWAAERQKANNRLEGNEGLQASNRAHRKHMLLLEIVPPVFSVATLIVVTIVVLHKAVHILSLDMHRKKSEQTNPNLKLMLTFSICNLVLDGVNVFSFAKAKHLFGFSIGDDIKYDTTGNESSSVSKEAESKLTSPQQQFSDNRRAGFSDSSEGNNPTLACDNGVFDSAQHHFGDEPSNLNMCSAFTHVFADTLRSLAVILAAGTAEAVPRVTPEEADATAAVVVSILIALSLVPLFRGVCKSVAEYQSISVEERFEVTAERPANEIDVA